MEYPVKNVPQRKDLLLELLVFCKIRPLERPRKAFNSQHFYQPKDNQLELFDELQRYQMLVARPIEEPVIIDIICSFAKGKSTADHPVAPAYGDEDNLRKAVNDALVEKLIMANDRYVIGGTTWKIYDEEDMGRIQIWRPYDPSEWDETTTTLVDPRKDP